MKVRRITAKKIFAKVLLLIGTENPLFGASSCLQLLIHPYCLSLP